MSETPRPIATLPRIRMEAGGSHDLADHLAGVAALAAGLRGDLVLSGRILRGCGTIWANTDHVFNITSAGLAALGRCPHQAGREIASTAGALLACDRFGAAGWCWPIVAGHHADC